MKKYFSLFLIIVFIGLIFNCTDSEDDSSSLSTNEIVFTNISPTENSTIEDNDPISVEGTYTFNDFSDSETYFIRLYLIEEIISDTQTEWDLLASAGITASSRSFQLSGDFDLTDAIVYPYEVRVVICQQTGTNSYVTRVTSNTIYYQ